MYEYKSSAYRSTSYSDLDAFRTHVVSVLPSSCPLGLLDPPLGHLEDLLVDLSDHGRDKQVLLAEAGVARVSRSY
jgi:hypothetical protein